MDWPTVLTIILGSSFLGAVLTNLSGWILSLEELNRHNSFLALTLAHAFEKYAYECMGAAGDHELHQDSGGSAGNPLGHPPKAFELPDETFKNFDLSLLDAVLDFPQKVAFATEEVDFMASVVDHDEASAKAYQNTIALASASVALAAQLRSHYKLSTRDLKFGEYDLRKLIDEKVGTKDHK